VPLNHSGDRGVTALIVNSPFFNSRRERLIALAHVVTRLSPSMIVANTLALAGSSAMALMIMRPPTEKMNIYAERDTAGGTGWYLSDNPCLQLINAAAGVIGAAIPPPSSPGADRVISRRLRPRNKAFPGRSSADPQSLLVLARCTALFF